MKPKSGYVRLTRRRWDGYFLTAGMLTIVIAARMWWSGFLEIRGPGRLLILPMLWAAVRWQTPREGQSTPTITAQPGSVPMLWWLGT